MKKNNLLQFVVLLCVFQITTISSSLSQGVDKPLSFGVRAGLSNSLFTNYQQRAGYNKWGFAGGAFAEYKLMDLVGVEINLNYVQEGADKATPNLIYTREFLNSYSETSYGGMVAYIQSSDITLHTLQVPILFNIRPPVKGDVTPRLILGYSFDFILNATTKDEIMFYSTDNPYSGYTYYPITKRNKANVTSSFKTLNMGPVVGLGLDFKSDKFTYLIDARYKIGVNNINNLGELKINGNRSFSANTFTVTLGIAF
jgi:hypothetical protein